MKKLFIVANWKSNKTSLEAKEWLQAIKNYELKITNEKEVVICPPFTLLVQVSAEIKQYNLPFKLGAQDISPFEDGPYTGEISGRQIKEFADYVIIGHSERRKYFGETEEIIAKKLEMAQRYNLNPILCISDVDQLSSHISHFSSLISHLIVAYEPLFAIGSGVPDNPENAEKVAHAINEKIKDTPILYGGSVLSSNGNNFTKQPNIHGVLVGGASLKGTEFAKIVENA